MAVLDRPDADASTAHRVDPAEIALQRRLDERLLWLSAWTIHHANQIRPKADAVKVGGHQASCASMTAIMAALYFGVARPQDRIAVKPHASPVFHAVQHLFGRQTIDNLKAFRAMGGAQSYPSRTKDIDDVDFSTGSVGLGVAITAFASLVQDMLEARGWRDDADMGRMIALLGDAELDEGNIYEALIEGAKHDLRNVWWVVDYNRQSLDAVTPARMFARYEDIFASCGWAVTTLKHGARQRALFAKPGGAAVREWIDAAPNDLYAALTFEGAQGWRARLDADLDDAKSRDLIAALSDDDLAATMTELGGHCPQTLLSAFRAAQADPTPRFFIAYTIKGYRLPFAGHKDNHAGVMTQSQVETLRETLGVKEGEEWDALSGVPGEEARAVRAYVDNAAFATPAHRRFAPAAVAPPADLPPPTGAVQATQPAFGKILADLAKSDHPFADRIVTMSPDVTVSTNLGGFVNRRGLFAREEERDLFKDRKLASPQTWSRGPSGQHVELGIAEHNLFLALGAFGLSGSLFDEPLFPIGTLYDPFIARGLDALNYACYQDARFIVVATPSGLALAPEGGAHQSLNTPLIGMGQPGLDAYEPAFADELAVIMGHAFARLQAEDGASTYLRLSTRPLTQPDRDSEASDWAAGAVAGAYWRIPPELGADLALVYCGVTAAEAEEAFEALRDDVPGAGLLAVTSPDVLHRDWSAAERARWTGEGTREAAVDRLLAPLSPRAGLVTVHDASPAALSWLGGVRGHRVKALGVEHFGQSGHVAGLFAHHRLDADAILDAAASLALDA